ncbi:MAG TPA: ribosome biogenesis GTPase Der [Anaerolineae bacterium]|nr:ribosome biogenesis GTPase Der [Anaerolineae bacterium]
MTVTPIVALVGRPNVGKSTLFNRLVGRRLAVVSEVAGTTRDRLYSDADWNGIAFTVVDTGGIEIVAGWHTQPLSEDSSRFLPLIRQQAEVAIQDADYIVHVVDGQAGITAADREIAQILRQTKKPMAIAANKLESVKLHDGAYEFYELGVGPVFPISALHGTGVGDLLDEIVDALPDAPPAWTDDDDEFDEDPDEDSIKIALLGRPNVGKSTLINRLLGQERAIVSPIAGTTRDAIDMELIWNDQQITLIDTAGIRRRGRIDPGIEKYSVLRSLKALKRADVALLLLDASEGITAQDAHIAGMIQDEAPGTIVLVNKWDTVEKDTYTINEYTEAIRRDLNFMPYVPLIFISAQTGQRVNKIFPLVEEVYDARYQRLPTSGLNKLLRQALSGHPPPSKAGVRVKFFYVTQVAVAPPTFVFFVNKPDWVHFSYQRYLENQIRETYPFIGTPIKLLFRARSEDRFADK